MSLVTCQRLFRAVKAIGSVSKAARFPPVFPAFSKCLAPVSFTRMATSYTVEERGPSNSLNYRLFFKNAGGNYVSPFHDIPLTNGGSIDDNVFNMVVEVPRWSNAKMEIKTTQKMNPIMQDVKKGKLRFVKNCFPHHGYIWNYGALPQTWENPGQTDEHTKCKGDNDPLDVCEIGSRVAKRGEVIQVKVLGVLAMIDEGETDWKILAIDTRDNLAGVLKDLDDIREHMPGFLEATFEWFKIYKVPDGKPLNTFAFDSQPKNRDFALSIIKHTHGQWQDLMNGKVDSAGIVCENVKVAGSAHMVTAEEAKAFVENTPETGEVEPVNLEVDAWHYVSQQ